MLAFIKALIYYEHIKQANGVNKMSQLTKQEFETRYPSGNYDEFVANDKRIRDMYATMNHAENALLLAKENKEKGWSND